MAEQDGSPKASNSKLYRLVASLNKSEKRLFRADIHPDSDMRRLFDVIEGHPGASEAEIQTQFKPKGQQRFALSKSYLYSRLLQSLHFHHLGQSAVGQLGAKIHEGQLLIEKGMPDAAGRLLKTAKKLAYATENFGMAIQVLKEERELIPAIPRINDRERVYAANLEEEKELLAVVEEQNTCMQLHNKVHFFYVRHSTDAEQADLVAEIREAISHPFFQAPHTLRSLTAQLFIRNALIFSGLFLNDHEACFHHSSEMVQILEGNPAFLKASRRFYITTLNNYLIGVQFSGRWDEIEPLVKKLATLRHLYQGPKSFASAAIFVRILQMQAHILNNMGEFEQTLALKSDANWGFQHFEGYLEPNRKAALRFSFAVAALGTGNWRDLLAEIEEIDRLPRTAVRPDIKKAIRQMRLVAWLELGDHELLDNLLETEKRHLNVRADLLRPQDQLLFEYLAAEVRKGNGQAVLDRPKDDFERDSVWTFAWHPGSWLRAKHLGKSYREVMRDYFSRLIKQGG